MTTEIIDMMMIPHVYYTSGVLEHKYRASLTS